MLQDKLILGSAPDSWGVWFAHDERQVSFTRFLDELELAGYKWLELGPYGFLPTDPVALIERLNEHGLRVSGGTALAALNRADIWKATVSHCREVARLTAAVGACHLVLLPSMYRDLSGAYSDEPHLTPEQQRELIARTGELGKILLEEFGVHLCVHPHADSHVETQADIERLLDGTDSRNVNLCLDTGHVAYGGGDAADLIRRYGERIAYVHMKHIDPAVLSRVRAENLSFSEAVRCGICVEPPAGVPNAASVIAALSTISSPLYVIVEHDLYPCEPDVPLPIAIRTRAFLSACVLRMMNSLVRREGVHHDSHS